MAYASSSVLLLLLLLSSFLTWLACLLFLFPLLGSYLPSPPLVPSCNCFGARCFNSTRVCVCMPGQKPHTQHTTRSPSLPPSLPSFLHSLNLNSLVSLVRPRPRPRRILSLACLSQYLRTHLSSFPTPRPPSRPPSLPPKCSELSIVIHFPFLPFIPPSNPPSFSSSKLLLSLTLTKQAETKSEQETKGEKDPHKPHTDKTPSPPSLPPSLPLNTQIFILLRDPHLGTHLKQPIPQPLPHPLARHLIIHLRREPHH